MSWAEMLADAGECPEIVVGPAVWQPGPNGTTKWYFIIVMGDTRRDARDGFRVVQMECDDCDSEAEAARNRGAFLHGVITGVATGGKPVIVHSFDGELEMARLCAVTWPSKRMKQILAGLEQELASKG